MKHGHNTDTDTDMSPTPVIICKMNKLNAITCVSVICRCWTLDMSLFRGVGATRGLNYSITCSEPVDAL